MFNFISFLEEHGATPYNENNYTMDCINPSCRKGKNHFQISIDPNKKVSHCFKCGRRYSWAGLVSYLKRIPYEEAKEIVEDVFWTKKEVKKEIAPVCLPIRSQWSNEAWDYLIGRGLTKEDIFDREFFYSTEFSKYRNRIILPVKMNGEIKAFQARSIDRQPKYLSSPNIGELCYGIDGIRDSKYVVICEGIFDQIAIEKVGLPAICTFSKKISKSQILLLKNAGVKRVDMMFDGDAVTETIKYFYELEKYFEVGIVPTGDKDPADCENIHEAISQVVDNIDDFQRTRMENFKRKFDKAENL